MSVVLFAKVLYGLNRSHFVNYENFNIIIPSFRIISFGYVSRHYEQPTLTFGFLKLTGPNFKIKIM